MRWVDCKGLRGKILWRGLEEIKFRDNPHPPKLNYFLLSVEKELLDQFRSSYRLQTMNPSGREAMWDWYLALVPVVLQPGLNEGSSLGLLAQVHCRILLLDIVTSVQLVLHHIYGICKQTTDMWLFVNYVISTLPVTEFWIPIVASSKPVWNCL